MISDEVILNALLSCGSVRKSAEKARCSQTTIRTRLANPAFRERYDQAKAEALSEAVDALKSRLELAIDALCDVLDNELTPPTVRVSAADAILRHGLRYIEIGDVEKRLDALEEAQREADPHEYSKTPCRYRKETERH